MNYSEQRQFLRQNQIWAAGLAVVLAVSAWASVVAARSSAPSEVIPFTLVIIALAISLSYTPSYLHLTVNPEKAPRWEFRIRWRVLGAALILGLIFSSGIGGRIIVMMAVAALGAANMAAKAVVPQRFYAAYYWITDFTLLATLLLAARCPLLLEAALLGAAAHLSIVVCQKHCFAWAALVALSASVLLLAAGRKLEQTQDINATLTAVALVLASALASAWLAQRAQEHNAKNVTAAIAELADFTGYSEERIRNLWLTSNQELARNWQKAQLAEDDREAMAQWYRDNSELYMFAISGYNLEYRRIRSNLYVLRFARGRCLDYGAGNGELLLEWARLGHAAMYYDVEGRSMEFARRRARQRDLPLEFASTKEDLTAAARERGFDTVFSFDVLEHVPDLAGELSFLSSLLSPGGRFMFDVPAGSTKSHPMHLNHNLEVSSYMVNQGLAEERSFLQKLSFKKQEKYVFRARA